MTQANTGASVGAESAGNPRGGELEARNRSRVMAMYQGRPDADKFLALMFLGAAPPEHTAAVLDSIQGMGNDLEKRVEGADGRPIRHFLNKTRAQLLREFKGDEGKVNAVAEALEALGMDVPGAAREVTAADETQTRAERPGVFGAPSVQATGRIVGANATPQRAFGTEQVPADEIWHLSDSELMGVEGITATDVVEIRRLQAANTAPAAPNLSGGLAEPGPDVQFAVEGTADEPADNAGGAPLGTGASGNGGGKGGKGKRGKAQGETPTGTPTGTPAATPTPTPAPAGGNA